MSKLPDILRPGKNKVILCFSIIITGRCNANCSYCHFFARRDRKKTGYDIPDELFNIYSSFISKAKRILPSNIEIQCRFSGGEPLVLGDRVFKLAEKIYKTSQIKPYILTNGKGISQRFIKGAQKSNINFLAVSLENPLNPDKGAANPRNIMTKIVKYNSDSLPIIPGVAIIKNEDFKDLHKICQIFYKKLKAIPTINELSFQVFVLPTKKQIADLYQNIFEIVKHFHLKTPIKLFPYISPELCYGGFKHYIIELDLENKHGLTEKNINKKLYSVLNQLNISYPKFNCKYKSCEWHNECRRVKWVWKSTFRKINTERKLKSYCEMKKTINNAFYEALKNFK